MDAAGQQEIPEGTVTVLFTDLVDSTRLNQALGDDGARAVGRQVEEMARAVVADNRGVLIKEMGDGLMAAFASARRAVAAAGEIQLEMGRLHRADLPDEVQMRIGLHTGEVIGEDGDIHGETVIIAKRIEGLAPAGGVLASETVYGVLGTAREELVDQGTAELKGIDNEWRLFLVPVPDDDREEAVLADNAPTPYIGRVAEREQLRTVIEAAAEGRGAMVLIGGPAGMGKSRLTRETTVLAERMGMTADQLTAMIGQAEVLVLDPDAKGGFADNINVLVPGGSVPSADEIEQQFAAIGATVKDVSTQSTDAGEVIRVRYTLPVSGKVQGEALVADVDGQAVTITVSASKRASTSTLVDGILGSLGTE